MAGCCHASVLFVRPCFRFADRLRQLQHAQEQLRAGRHIGFRLQRSDGDLRQPRHFRHPRFQSDDECRQVYRCVSIDSIDRT